MIEFLKNHWFLWIMLSLASLLVFFWLKFNRKFKFSIPSSIILSLIHTIFGVFTVVFFAFLESGFNPSSLGNISIYGGIFLMPLMYFVVSKIYKQNFLLMLDIFTPALVITLLLARINCLHAGCCYGIEIGNSEFRFPAREIEIFFHLIFLLWCVPALFKNKTQGYIFPIYLICYSITRFTIEWFRVTDTTMVLHFGHIWSIVAFTIGLSVIIISLKIARSKGV